MPAAVRLATHRQLCGTSSNAHGIGEFAERGEVMVRCGDLSWRRGGAPAFVAAAALDLADLVAQALGHRDVVVLALGHMQDVGQNVAMDALPTPAVVEHSWTGLVHPDVFGGDGVLEGMTEHRTHLPKCPVVGVGQSNQTKPSSQARRSQVVEATPSE